MRDARRSVGRMDGTILNTPGPRRRPARRTEPLPDNVADKEDWLRVHPRDVIRVSEGHKLGVWYECVRDSRQLCEASDLGLLIKRLKADFDTPGSREP